MDTNQTPASDQNTSSPTSDEGSLSNEQKVALFKKRSDLEANLFSLDAATRMEHIVGIQAVQTEMRQFGIKEDEYGQYLSTLPITH